MSKLWVLIADSSRAELLEIEGIGKSIKVLKKFEHPKSRAKNRAIDTDRPGRVTDRVGGQRHAMEPKVTPHRHECQIFAHELIDALESYHNDHEFEQFAIVAPAAFLGELNHVIPKNLKRALLKEVTHDIAGIPDQKKRHDLVCKYLDLWNHD